jgi:hypothetical protein
MSAFAGEVAVVTGGPQALGRPCAPRWCGWLLKRLSAALTDCLCRAYAPKLRTLPGGSR